MANDFYLDADNNQNTGLFSGMISVEAITGNGSIDLVFHGEDFHLESGYVLSEEFNEYTPAILSCEGLNNDFEDGIVYVLKLKLSSNTNFDILSVQEKGIDSDLQYQFLGNLLSTDKLTFTE